MRNCLNLNSIQVLKECFGNNGPTVEKYEPFKNFGKVKSCERRRKEKKSFFSVRKRGAKQQQIAQL